MHWFFPLCPKIWILIVLFCVCAVCLCMYFKCILCIEMALTSHAHGDWCRETGAYGGGGSQTLVALFSLLTMKLIIDRKVVYSLSYAHFLPARALVFGLPRLLLNFLHALTLILTFCEARLLRVGLLLFTEFCYKIFCRSHNFCAFFLPFSLFWRELGRLVAIPVCHFCNLDLVEISPGSFIQPKAN